MSDKVLYEFEAVKKVTSRKDADGVIEEKIVDVPVSFTIRKPSARQRDNGAEFYAIEFNKNLKKGMLSKAMMQKKIVDADGIFTKEQQERHLELSTQRAEKEIELQNFVVRSSIEKPEDYEETLNKLINDISILSHQMAEFEASIQNVYQHTADHLALNSTVKWYLTELAYYSENGMEAKRLFSGIDFEERYENLLKKADDESDENFQKAIDRLLHAVTIFCLYGVTDKAEIKKSVESQYPIEEVKEVEEPEEQPESEPS